MTTPGTTSSESRVTAIGAAKGKFRCLWLLVTLFALLAVYPYLLTKQGGPSLLLLALTSAVLISGVYAVCRSLAHLLIGTGLLLPALYGNWWALVDVHPAIGIVLMLSETGFYVFLIVLLMRHVLHGRVHLLDKLFGALSVYLLIGLAFFTVFELLYMLDPGSLRGPNAALDWSDILFFSYVTLTTLGYGDITPVTPVAQSIAVLEVIVGVFYMAVLVAWLVGSLGALRTDDVTTSI